MATAVMTPRRAELCLVLPDKVMKMQTSVTFCDCSGAMFLAYCSYYELPVTMSYHLPLVTISNHLPLVTH